MACCIFSQGMYLKLFRIPLAADEKCSSHTTAYILENNFTNFLDFHEFSKIFFKNSFEKISENFRKFMKIEKVCALRFIVLVDLSVQTNWCKK